MTLLEALEKLIGPATGLVAVLDRAGREIPELKPQADEWIAKLNLAISQGNLIGLAAVLPQEIANLAHGHVDPRKHPSDAA